MKKKKIYKAWCLIAAIYCGTIASNGDIEPLVRLICAILCGCFATIFVLLKD
jgi:4-hydroxybenzoate polyprenyltransferase